MIPITRFDGSRIYINAELIQRVEAMPDTVIALTDGTRIIVRETPEAIVEAVIGYRQRIHREPLGRHEGG